MNAGGKAEAAGSNFETLVSVWYANAALLGSAAQPPFDLPADTRILAFSCQPESVVDDVNAETSDGGILYVQAKRRVALSSSAKSALGKSLDQFVRQLAAGDAPATADTSPHPLDPSRDRLVLATRSSSSKKVTDTLPELLRRVRDRSDLRTLLQVAVTQGERAVARTVETVLKRSWKKAYGHAPSHTDLNRLLRLMWIQVLDLESGGHERRHVLEQLRSNLLAQPTQSTLTFSELYRLCARLRAERSGSDRASLLQVLGNAGIALTALPDYRRDIEALKHWTNQRLKAGPRFTRLLVDEPKSVIERACGSAFAAAAAAGSLLLVGEPGGGAAEIRAKFVQLHKKLIKSRSPHADAFSSSIAWFCWRPVIP